MKTYQIHLIRHGITDGNINGQYIGSTDLPLCAQGEEQLRRLCSLNDYPGAGAFFVSPMTRCQQTAQILYPEAKPIVIHEFRECDFGDFEGLTAAQLSDSEDFAKWMSAPETFAPPRGESGQQFSARVFEAFEAVVNGLLKTGITSAVIITHGGVISSILSRYGLPRAEPVEWSCPPGEGYSMRIHPQLWMTGQVAEVYSRIPIPMEASDDED